MSTFRCWELGAFEAHGEGVAPFYRRSEMYFRFGPVRKINWAKKDSHTVDFDYGHLWGGKGGTYAHEYHSDAHVTDIKERWIRDRVQQYTGLGRLGGFRFSVFS